MKNLILAAALLWSPVVLAQEVAPLDWEKGGAISLSDPYWSYMILGLNDKQKMIFNLRQDGVFELGEGQTPKSAAEFFLANSYFECPKPDDMKRTNMQYFPLVLAFRDNNKGGIGWSIDIDWRGRVTYTGLDYVGPHLTEFMNIVADARKCE